jgi:hypothetical protein
MLLAVGSAARPAMRSRTSGQSARVTLSAVHRLGQLCGQQHDSSPPARSRGGEQNATGRQVSAEVTLRACQRFLTCCAVSSYRQDVKDF